MASNPNTVTTQPAYDKWCNLNNFKSKLPKTVRGRKEAALAEDREKQQSLDPHIITDVPRERVVPYSDDLFRDVAIQWLVETHQVRCILDV